MTTTISTLDELRAVEEGGQISVTGGVHPKVWTRFDGEFRCDGVRLGVDMFTGAVQEGRVTRMSTVTPPLIGVAYLVGGSVGIWVNVVLRVEEGQVHYVRMRRGSFHAIDAVLLEDTGEWVPLAEQPPWVGAVYSTAVTLWATRQSLEQARNEVGVQRERADEAQRREFPDGFIDGLHALYSEFDDSDDLARVNNYLAQFGQGQAMDHDMDVTLRGTSYLEPSPDDIRAQLGNNAFTIVGTEDTTVVHWRRSFTLTREGVGCTCDGVDVHDEDVRAYWPADCDADSVEVDVSCS